MLNIKAQKHPIHYCPFCYLIYMVLFACNCLSKCWLVTQDWQERHSVDGFWLCPASSIYSPLLRDADCWGTIFFAIDKKGKHWELAFQQISGSLSTSRDGQVLIDLIGIYFLDCECQCLWVGILTNIRQASKQSAESLDLKAFWKWGHQCNQPLQNY